MAEIPERWQGICALLQEKIWPVFHNSVDVETILALAEELGAAEARIRELEQERDRLPANWFEDSSLATWFPLTAEELECSKTQVAVLCNAITDMQAQLQAVTQELQEVRQERASGSIPECAELDGGDSSGAVHRLEAIKADLKSVCIERAQLQARNQELESALRDADATLAPCNCLCDVTRTREIIRAALAHKPSPEVKP